MSQEGHIGRAALILGVDDAPLHAGLSKAKRDTEAALKGIKTNLKLKASADTRQAKSELEGLDRSVAKVKDRKVQIKASADTRAASRDVANLEKAISQLKQVAAGGIVVAGVTEVGRELASTEQAAFSLRRTYGATASDWVKFSKDMQNATRSSDEAFAEASATMGTLVEKYGLSAQQGRELVKVSADLGASRPQFIGVAEAAERVQSAIRGEAEASEYLGVVLNDTYMRNQAFGGALKDTWEKLSDNQKAQYRYQELLRQAQKYEGAASEATKLRAGQLDQLRNRLQDVTAEYGSMLGPAQAVAMAAPEIATGIGGVAISADVATKALSSLKKRLAGVSGKTSVKLTTEIVEEAGASAAGEAAGNAIGGAVGSGVVSRILSKLGLRGLIGKIPGATIGRVAGGAGIILAIPAAIRVGVKYDIFGPGKDKQIEEDGGYAFNWKVGGTSIASMPNWQATQAQFERSPILKGLGYLKDRALDVHKAMGLVTGGVRDLTAASIEQNGVLGTTGNVLGAVNDKASDLLGYTEKQAQLTRESADAAKAAADEYKGYYEYSIRASEELARQQALAYSREYSSYYNRPVSPPPTLGVGTATQGAAATAAASLDNLGLGAVLSARGAPAAAKLAESEEALKSFIESLRRGEPDLSLWQDWMAKRLPAGAEAAARALVSLQQRLSALDSQRGALEGISSQIDAVIERQKTAFVDAFVDPESGRSVAQLRTRYEELTAAVQPYIDQLETIDQRLSEVQGRRAVLEDAVQREAVARYQPRIDRTQADLDAERARGEDTQRQMEAINRSQERLNWLIDDENKKRERTRELRTRREVEPLERELQAATAVQERYQANVERIRDSERDVNAEIARRKDALKELEERLTRQLVAPRERALAAIEARQERYSRAAEDVKQREADINSEIERRKRLLEELQERLTRRRVEPLQEQLRGIEASARRYGRIAEDAKRRESDINTEIERRKGLLDALSERLTRQRVAPLERSLEAVKASQERYGRAAEDARAREAAINAELERRKELLDRARDAALRSQVGPLEAQLAAVEARKERYGRRAEDLARGEADINAQIEKRRRLLDEAQAAAERQQLLPLQRQLDATEARTERLQDAIERIDKQRSALEDRMLGGLRDRVEAARRAVEPYAERLGEVRDRHAELSTSLAELNDRLEHWRENAIAAALASRSALSPEFNTLGEQADAYAAKLDRANQKLQDVTSTASRLRSQGQTVAAEIERRLNLHQAVPRWLQEAQRYAEERATRLDAQEGELTARAILAERDNERVQGAAERATAGIGEAPAWLVAQRDRMQAEMERVAAQEKLLSAQVKAREDRARRLGRQLDAAVRRWEAADARLMGRRSGLEKQLEAAQDRAKALRRELEATGKRLEQRFEHGPEARAIRALERRARALSDASARARRDMEREGRVAEDLQARIEKLTKRIEERYRKGLEGRAMRALQRQSEAAARASELASRLMAREQRRAEDLEKQLARVRKEIERRIEHGSEARAIEALERQSRRAGAASERARHQMEREQRSAEDLKLRIDEVTRAIERRVQRGSEARAIRRLEDEARRYSGVSDQLQRKMAQERRKAEDLKAEIDRVNAAIAWRVEHGKEARYIQSLELQSDKLDRAAERAQEKVDAQARAVDGLNKKLASTRKAIDDQFDKGLSAQRIRTWEDRSDRMQRSLRPLQERLWASQDNAAKLQDEVADLTADLEGYKGNATLRKELKDLRDTEAKLTDSKVQATLALMRKEGPWREAGESLERASQAAQKAWEVPPKLAAAKEALNKALDGIYGKLQDILPGLADASVDMAGITERVNALKVRPQQVSFLVKMQESQAFNAYWDSKIKQIEDAFGEFGGYRDDRGGSAGGAGLNLPGTPLGGGGGTSRVTSYPGQPMWYGDYGGVRGHHGFDRTPTDGDLRVQATMDGYLERTNFVPSAQAYFLTSLDGKVRDVIAHLTNHRFPSGAFVRAGTPIAELTTRRRPGEFWGGTHVHWERQIRDGVVQGEPHYRLLQDPNVYTPAWLRQTLGESRPDQPEEHRDDYTDLSREQEARLQKMLGRSGLATYGDEIARYARRYDIPVPLALAQFRQEESWMSPENNLSRANRNPGNLRWAEWEREHGGRPGYGGFTLFPSVAAGLEAYFHLLDRGYRSFVDEKDWQGLIEKYAPAYDNPDLYQNGRNIYAEHVAKWIPEYRDELAGKAPIKYYADGGWISERVHGVGVVTGNRYVLGEEGPEYVLPPKGREPRDRWDAILGRMPRDWERLTGPAAGKVRGHATAISHLSGERPHGVRLNLPSLAERHHNVPNYAGLLDRAGGPPPHSRWTDSSRLRKGLVVADEEWFDEHTRDDVSAEEFVAIRAWNHNRRRRQ